ncbi:Serine phosphatase RsbU, regulator of sigma subunit [Thermomonospora echinospora]|uniref:Serine phosphatase RsbU, regulator of sigma subunit n=1 Tax=Thermomonospora echinospora TaxID=1992 RepID=A0A1H6CAY9_9ACTN|nr:SpoIIE family protein phosphatase [Thermomonospora echinospora]SEG70149.1 Serine phosphatase RsbU, regulator of sigma subunit [Thermomonospora echinospora]
MHTGDPRELADGGPPPTAPPTEPATGSGEGADGGVGRLASTVERLRRQIEQAEAAADGRALIELAKGVLVERLRCGPAQAARQLDELAQEAGRSPLELAAEIIDQAAQDRLSEVAREFLAGTGPARPDDDEAAAVALRLRTAESGALAAGDAQAVAESLLEHALSPLGATAVAIWAAGPDASLTLAGWAGFSAEEPARWRYVPPGVVTPARCALADRRMSWYLSLSRTSLPSIGHRDLPDGGRVAVPAGVGGRVLGVLEICWPDELEPQPPQIERQIEALAELCAHTLETHSAPSAVVVDPPYVAQRELVELVDLADGLHDPALVLRPHLDADGRLADFRVHHVNGRFVDPAGRPRAAVRGGLLLETYPMAAGQSGLFEIVERVHATGEPFRAERMALTALVDQVPLPGDSDISVSRLGDGILLIWRIEDEAARLARLLQHAQRLVRIGGFEESILTGKVTWNEQLFALYGLEPTAEPVPLRRLPDHAHIDDEAAIGRFLRSVLHHHRSASAAFRLQRPDGIARHMRVVAEPVLDAQGQLLAVRGAYQDISAQHWTEVALAATRDQLAHTEQQAAERNRLARQLQQAIMPPTRGPIDALGLHIVTRYRPAEKDHLVGGDWYDAVVLPSKQVMLCVGDVAGHGIEAATDMVVLRNALRGLATTGAGPGQLLTWLNQVAHHLTDNVTATALCALYDPATRVLRWARAGHLPPVLVRGQEDATTLPMVGGLLLGALAEAEYQEGELQLQPGDILLMYTDGLVERKDRSMQESLQHLMTTAQTPTDTLEQRLDYMLTHSNSDTDDDTCLVGVRLP